MDEGDAPVVEARECPMCGEFMRLMTRQQAQHIPGLPAPVKHVIKEWVCPECDYFEEVDD